MDNPILKLKLESEGVVSNTDKEFVVSNSIKSLEERTLKSMRKCNIVTFEEGSI